LTEDDESTLDSASIHSTRGDDLLDALVVLAASNEHDRAGETLLLPSVTERRPLVFGRGDEPHGSHPRARLVRQRPGESAPTAPIRSAWISRAQLLVGSHPDGGVTIENVGKSRLVIDGVVSDGGRARPGDVIEVGRRLALLCTQRPEVLPPLRGGAGEPPFLFGDRDASGYVGESPEAWRLRDEVDLVASRREHVLILGESGTGKELVAGAIHANGPRSSRRFLARNAATVPPGIIDAELFGNAPNYPNVGMAERPGLVGEADGGTLFLDEIGELPAELQAHLLRFLDAGEYQRLGDARRRTVDVRVVAATNRPVAQLKTDLAARFSLRVTTPALHARREDVPLVARHLLRTLVDRGDPHAARFITREGEPRIAQGLVVALVRHLFTTHVRELQTILYRAALESSGDEVELTAGARALLGWSGEGEREEGSREVTREEIVATLARNGGVREKAWRDLGLANRYVLKRLLKKHGIEGD
jgi:transcriptional regulator with AAA-type ATPase domain